MSKTLTVGSVEKLRPGAVRREVPDSGCPGLYLAIQPSGAKSWTLRFRSPIERDSKGQRKAKKLTLGPVATFDSEDEPEIGKPLSLSQARVLATRALEQVRRKIDPTHVLREDKAKARAEAISNSVNTIDAAAVLFLTRYKGKKKQGLRDSTRSLSATYLGLKRDESGNWIKNGAGVLKRWSGRPIASITKRDVRDLVESISDSGHGVTANRTLTTLKTVFKFAVSRELIVTSPAEAVEAPAAEQARDRVLSDAELAALWRVADAEAYPFGRLVQMLILTGARRDELREAPWSEFDLDGALWRLPAARAKNGLEHQVPLSGLAIEILEGMPRIKGGLLFTTTGKTPISGLTRARRRLHDEMVKELRKSDPKAELPHWTLHDLRRSVATGMADKCDVEPHIIEAALNHVSGARRGVAGIYNRAKYTDQIGKALEAWALYVNGLVNGQKQASVVVPLRRARR